MGNENVVHSHNGVLFSCKIMKPNRQVSDETGKHCTERSDSEPGRKMLCFSSFSFIAQAERERGVRKRSSSGGGLVGHRCSGGGKGKGLSVCSCVRAFMHACVCGV